jgi:GrpB-like predicted nucleotidyltransferase (UPF0157 family)
VLTHESRQPVPWLISNVSLKAGMHLTLSDNLAPVLQVYLPAISARLSELLPKAEFHHVGATAIPRAVTKGDVDVLLRVEQVDFPSAVGVLRSRFEIRQPENWTAVFASFGDDSSYPFPLGVQLVVRDSEADFFLFLHEYFTSDFAHLSEYNRIKTESAPRGSEEYWKAKDRYLSSILASQPRTG